MTAPIDTMTAPIDSPSGSSSFFMNPSPRAAAIANFFTGSSESKTEPVEAGEAAKTSKTPTNIPQIEAIIGFISEQYKCENSSFAGTMYVGPLAVVWLGRIFFFERTVIIKWEDVVQVQKQENGVRFLLRSKATHDFSKLFHPEKAWSSLVSLHNDSVIDKPIREPTPRQVTRSLRRMNSDPLKMTFGFDDADKADSVRRPMTPRRQKRDVMSRTASEPIKSDEAEVDMPATGDETDTKMSLEHKWSLAVEGAYAQKAVESHELPCSLDSFLQLFIEDTAEYSLQRFMKESGDEGIQCTSWKVGADGVTKTRTIEYTHPVNAPMAPPMARARKEQTYTIFGQHGLVLETRTYVSDVPMTDCFYVADQIRVEPTSEKSVAVSMSFDLEFVKSTMFRAIIMRTTKGEFESSMKRLANYMSESLGQAASSALPPPVPEQEASPSEWFPIFAAIFLTLVVLLQTWILLDVRSIKVALRELQSSYPAECTSLSRMTNLERFL